VPHPKLRLAALAAAACTLSPLAGAQSNVTIYGTLDVFVAQQGGSGISSRKVLGSGYNPNNLGFAGREDLGGGLAAGFTMEGQPVLDTGTYAQGGKFFGRQANVWLDGGFGRITAGRIHLPGRGFSIKYTATGLLSSDPLGMMALSVGSMFGPLMNGDAIGGRVSNALMYSSPRMGGFSFSVLQSAGEGGLFSAGQAKLMQIGAGYSAGPFAVDFVYAKIPELAGSQLPQTDYAFGAQYTIGGGFKVMASYFSHEGVSVAAPGATTAIAGSKGTDKSTLLGLVYNTGPHTVGASYGMTKVAGVHRGRRPGNMTAPFATIVDDMTGFSLSYTYALSRRTQLFAAYGSLDNDALGSASYTFDLRPTAGGKSTLVASGIRHSF
jgi:predicted porin